MADKIVRLAFDPRESNERTRECFRNPIARTMWLLWRPGHLVSSDFADYCLEIARRIERQKPQTVEVLKRCISPSIGYYVDFSEFDVNEFCPEALPFFQGLKSVDYQVG